VCKIIYELAGALPQVRRYQSALTSRAILREQGGDLIYEPDKTNTTFVIKVGFSDKA